MQFPSLEYVNALIDTLNADTVFNRVSLWSDVKVLLVIGEERYWMKWYGGRVIDVMAYFPLANPLGWDYMVSAPLATWLQLRDGSRALGHLLDKGEISLDGNLLQANRLYEANNRMLAAIRDLKE